MPIGPEPSDFRAAFRVGADGEHLHPVDGLGVSLAAIQGLYELVQRQASEIAGLRRCVEAAGRERAQKS